MSNSISLKRLADLLADLGLTTRATRRHPNAKTVSIAKWHSMLRDPYYTGVVTYKDEVHPGRHEPLVTAELFAQVQDVLAERSAPTRKDRTHFHHLKRLLYCDRCFDKGRVSQLIFTQARGGGGTYGYSFCTARKQGTCDLPYLPVPVVERAVVRHYETIDIPEDFITEVSTHLKAALEDEQANVQALHSAIAKKRRIELDQREERLIDLAESGLPAGKIRSRLNSINQERSRLDQDFAKTGEELSAGADRLLAAIELLQHVPGLYEQAINTVRGRINAALFHRFYIEEDGIHEHKMRQPFDEIAEAATSYTTRQTTMPQRTGAKRYRTARALLSP